MLKAGYVHYEVSNFSRPEQACAHNINYWKGGNYFGCGPSAHSHWQGERYANVNDIERYCASLNSGKSIKVFSERLPDKAKAKETLVMWLRLIEGVDLKMFEEKTGYSVPALYEGELADLMHQGLLQIDEKRMRIPEKHHFISDAIFSELV
jgi:oxygen-independent coproporphyrinogen-3 oxidase